MDPGRSYAAPGTVDGVCAHMKEAGHRGAEATLQRLPEYCHGFGMKEHVVEFVKQCLH